MKKYELLEDKHFSKIKLHQILALRDFGDVKVGDLGGYIQSEDNLSHDGDCWVYDNAKVYGEARVYGDAKISGVVRIFDSARVYGEAHVYGAAKISGVVRIFDSARVYDEARVYGAAKISGVVRIFDSARVYDDARVSNDSCIYGKAWVYGSARVYCEAEVRQDSKVYDNAHVFDSAIITRNAKVYGNAKVCQSMRLMSVECSSDLSKDLESNIRCQTGLDVIDGKIECWKYVNEDLSSWYDSEFKYEVGAWAEVLDYDESDKSCTSGLHVSNKEFWKNQLIPVLLRCYVELDDIITVQMGKIRCKRLYVVEICN